MKDHRGGPRAAGPLYTYGKGTRGFSLRRRQWPCNALLVTEFPGVDHGKWAFKENGRRCTRGCSTRKPFRLRAMIGEMNAAETMSTSCQTVLGLA